MFHGNKIYKMDSSGKMHRILFIPGISISFKGKNSAVIVHEPLPRFKNCKIRVGNHCKIEILESIFKIKKLAIMAKGEFLKCRIGNNFSCTNNCEIHIGPEDNLEVTIGNGCMFGRNVIIRATDGHKIIDRENMRIVNCGSSVNIGNNVWIAENCTVLKGVTIPNNCIIGTKSVVTKSCTMPFCLYAGIPAKLVKSNVTWQREVPCHQK